MTRPLQAGELIMLVDRKKRRYLTTLADGGEFHSHAGALAHDTVIGEEEGQEFRSSKGAAYLVVRPTLSDFVLKMKRGAQVIYPKDLGPILLQADIFPGARVFESGLGSGALSMTLLRAGAQITGYELRDDFAEQAQANVAEFLGSDVLDRYDVHVRSSYEALDHGDFDRMVLDLPEPWYVVPHAAQSLAIGGLILAYTPSIIQATNFKAALNEHGFAMAETIEVLHRGWHVEPAQQAVRPDHRMVAHTGFLTTARKLKTAD
ncbi:MAG: tRNA (adenine-N1)-methyltransferase [Actinomycetota bacterium]